MASTPKGKKQRRLRFVLALDGGGAKGLYQLHVLKRLEEKIPGIITKFDYIIGTSVGALVAATVGLKRMEPEGLIPTFEGLLGKVFARSLIARYLPPVEKYILSPVRLFLNQPKYGAEVMEKELVTETYFGKPKEHSKESWRKTISNKFHDLSFFIYDLVNDIRETISWITGIDFERRNTDWRRKYPNAQTLADYPPDLDKPGKEKIPLVAFVGTNITSDQPSAHVFRNYKIPVSHKSLDHTPARLYHYSWYPEDTRPEKKRVWEVLRASTAAPGYFPAIVIENERRFTDGGLVANNPAEIALQEAMLQWPDDEIVLVSVGCGATDPNKPPSENGVLRLFKSWWKPLMAPNILTASEGIHERVQLHLQTFDLNAKYFRFDPPGLGDLELDNVPEIKKNVYKVTQYLDGQEARTQIEELLGLFQEN